MIARYLRLGMAVLLGIVLALDVVRLTGGHTGLAASDLFTHPPASVPRAVSILPSEGPTNWPALNHAIHKIPTYQPGVTRWEVTDKYGHWGTNDWYDRVIYISPDVPDSKLYDVASHEWSHTLQARDYNWNIDAAVQAMDDWYHASGMYGAEYAADCMAIEQGARWTNYTSCQDEHWREGARRLLHGYRL